MRHTVIDGTVTVFLEGVGLLSAEPNHPNYELIRDKCRNDDEEGLENLFDPTNAVVEKFKGLSERMSVANGRVYFDGDEENDVLTDQILRFLKEGVEDWKPLVKFRENLAANPNEHSRENLYRWLKAERFTIDEDGLIVGYKGVNKDAEGNFISVMTGSAVVDGMPVNGHVKNNVGSVVEMPRSAVQHDPKVGCSTGLHVGTWGYASKFGRHVVEVRVNPSAVVSVPTECRGEKLRCHKYKVEAEVTAPHKTPLLASASA